MTGKRFTVQIPNPCEDCSYYNPEGKGFEDCNCPKREKNGNCTCQYILPNHIGDDYE